MKERPILFTCEMVRAILDGRKTQTRRLVKNQKHPHGTWATPEEVAAEFIGGTCAFSPPKGRVGDLLWVCETFYWEEGSDKTTEQVAYRASTEMPPEVKAMGCCWTPSIHMPRWASRIDLEITAVRVERVQDITEEEAKAEGVESVMFQNEQFWKAYGSNPIPGVGELMATRLAAQSFRTLWQSIYSNWDANPFVWVYEFRRIKP